LRIAHIVEHIELHFGTEVGGIGDACRAQVGFCLLRHIARVARVPLARDGVYHIANHAHGRHFGERVHKHGLGVGHQQHVGDIDGLEAADGGAIEADALVEYLLRERLNRHREVMPHAEQVGELDIDHTRVMLARELNCFAWTHTILL
jgi:hypothetical protein